MPLIERSARPVAPSFCKAAGLAIGVFLVGALARVRWAVASAHLAH